MVSDSVAIVISGSDGLGATCGVSPVFLLSTVLVGPVLVWTVLFGPVLVWTVLFGPVLVWPGLVWPLRVWPGLVWPLRWPFLCAARFGSTCRFSPVFLLATCRFSPVFLLATALIGPDLVSTCFSSFCAPSAGVLAATRLASS